MHLFGLVAYYTMLPFQAWGVGPLYFFCFSAKRPTYSMLPSSIVEFFLEAVASLGLVVSLSQSVSHGLLTKVDNELCKRKY